MGRPRKGPELRKRYQLSLDPDAVARIDAAAAAEGMDRSSFVERAALESVAVAEQLTEYRVELVPRRTLARSEKVRAVSPASALDLAESLHPGMRAGIVHCPGYEAESDVVRCEQCDQPLAATETDSYHLCLEDMTYLCLACLQDHGES